MQIRYFDFTRINLCDDPVELFLGEGFGRFAAIQASLMGLRPRPYCVRNLVQHGEHILFVVGFIAAELSEAIGEFAW